MFQQISWAEYIQAITLLLVVYYLYVLARYYRQDIPRLLQFKRVTGTSLLNRDQPAAPATHSTAPKQDSYADLVGALTGELQAYTTEAGLHGLDKMQVMESLQRILHKYSSIKDSPYRQGIQYLIAEECQSSCSLFLTEGELNQLWGS